MQSSAVPLWQRPAMREIAGETLRPGGFTLTDRAARYMGMIPGWRVLDVGCGLGATVGRLRSRFGAAAVGVEQSFSQLESAPQKTGLVQGQGDALPFLTGSFNAVFCECVLSLFPDTVRGIEEFRRVLAPRGYLALSDIHAQGPEMSESGSCAERAKSFHHIRSLLEKSGFSIRLAEDHTRHLKHLAAQLLLSGTACHCGEKRALGYYLLIAQKDG